MPKIRYIEKDLSPWKMEIVERVNRLVAAVSNNWDSIVERLTDEGAI